MFRTVVWACDGHPHDHDELAYVRELCRAHRCRLWIAHAAQPATAQPSGRTEPDRVEERAIGGLKARTHSLREEGIDASLHVIRGVAGSPAAAIAQLVRDVDADLLVLGAGRRRRRHRPSPGATATALLTTAGCAVLWLDGLAGISDPSGNDADADDGGPVGCAPVVR